MKWTPESIFFSNGGTLTTNTVGHIQNLGNAWVSKDALTNIVSFTKVTDKFRITYDSEQGDEFCVHKPKGVIMKFLRSTMVSTTTIQKIVPSLWYKL